MVEVIKVDRRKYPRSKYHVVGYEARQVFDMKISRVVMEYRAEIVEDAEGKRIHKYFEEQMGIPLSEGSVFNVNKDAHEFLEAFEGKTKEELIKSAVLHADETGMNKNGDRYWLRSASNSLWTHFFPHERRGTEAMDSIGILPQFRGILCHDHLKLYYTYTTCTHALCNAHHLRELEGVWEEDNKQRWAKETKALLEEINCAIKDAGGLLETHESEKYRQRYRAILQNAETECPPPDKTSRKGKGGRVKKDKSPESSGTITRV
ncbi:Transposase IS66 family protein [Candidatus Brocadiaceae bacterium B188]|nr:Transposase IS66 family protein [Candidatus Brocadiaceae bacterium B188]